MLAGAASERRAAARSGIVAQLAVRRGVLRSRTYFEGRGAMYIGIGTLEDGQYGPGRRSRPASVSACLPRDGSEAAAFVPAFRRELRSVSVLAPAPFYGQVTRREPRHQSSRAASSSSLSLRRSDWFARRMARPRT